MTSASHAEGRQFDPGQVYFLRAPRGVVWDQAPPSLAQEESEGRASGLGRLQRVREDHTSDGPQKNNSMLRHAIYYVYSVSKSGSPNGEDRRKGGWGAHRRVGWASKNTRESSGIRCASLLQVLSLSPHSKFGVYSIAFLRVQSSLNLSCLVFICSVICLRGTHLLVRQVAEF